MPGHDPESEKCNGKEADTANTFVLSAEVDTAMTIAHVLSCRKKDALVKRKLSEQQSPLENCGPEHSEVERHSSTRRAQYARRRHYVKKKKACTEISKIVRPVRFGKCRQSHECNTEFDAKYEWPALECQSKKLSGEPINRHSPTAKKRENCFRKKWRDWHRSHVRKKKCNLAAWLIRIPNKGSYFHR